MLCEECRAKDATVHVSFVVAPRGELIEHHFCASCYPTAKARDDRRPKILAQFEDLTSAIVQREPEEGR
jgi:protein-arginine kinase activator protein McsA